MNDPAKMSQHGEGKGEYFLLISTEKMRDGEESFNKLFKTKAEALQFASKVAETYFAGGNYQFELYECVLKQEVKLKRGDVVEPQPAKVTRRIVEA